MSKIYEIHPGWMSKSEIAYKLGVSERTIYARWKRGELLRKEVQGQVLWAELPEEGKKEAEETTSSARFHRYPEGFGSRGSWPSASKEKWEQRQQSLSLLEKENTRLRLSLVKAEEALVHVANERDRLQRQNEILLGLLGRQTIWQKFFAWLKNFGIDK